MSATDYAWPYEVRTDYVAFYTNDNKLVWFIYSICPMAKIMTDFQHLI